MNVSAASFQLNASVFQTSHGGQGTRALSIRVEHRQDILSLGAGGKVSQGQAQNMVLERAYERLMAIVDGARAELGIPEGTILDTSPEATANRILDFALGAFGAFSENHPELEGEEARSAFAEFIGAAIDQGIAEARGILTALSALDPGINAGIDSTASIIHAGLADFAANGF